MSLLNRSTRVVTGLVATAGLLATAVAPATAAPTSDPDARDTAAFLARQLAEHDYLLPGPVSDDWGLTIDAVFALAATGIAGNVVEATTDRLQVDGWNYLQWSCYSDIGSFAKLALALQVGGGDPRHVDVADAIDPGFDFCQYPPYPDHGSFPGGDQNGDTLDLIALVREMSALSEADPDSPSYGRIGRESNHFDQSLAMLVLARTPQGVPDSAIDYVRTLQCLDAGDPNYGGLGYDDDNPATSPCETVDGDATGMELSALLAAGLTASDPTVARAVEWMDAVQRPDGSFPAANPSGQDGNSNSTGLVASAARQVGGVLAEGVAGKADTYLRGLQVSCGGQITSVDDPSVPGFARSWVGAIAFVSEAFDRAVSSGIQLNEQDQWRRATAQAVLGLGGLPDWSAITAQGAAPETPLPACAPVAVLGVSTATAPVPAGSAQTMRITGLGSWERYTVTLSGVQIVTGVSPEDGGAVQLTYQVPAGTTTASGRVLAVVGGAPGRTGSTTLTTVGGGLKVTRAKAKVTAGRRQVVRVSGLLPGEPVRIKVKGMKAKTRVADARGEVRYSFKAKKPRKRKSVTVRGQVSGLRGTTAFKVR